MRANATPLRAAGGLLDACAGAPGSRPTLGVRRMRSMLPMILASVTWTSLVVRPAAAEPPAPPAWAAPPPSWSRSPLRYERRPEYRLLAVGAGLFVAMYGATLLSNVIVGGRCVQPDPPECRGTSWRLDVPIAGPFIQMQTLQEPGAGTVRVALAFNGIFQIGGIVTMIVGAAMRRPYPVFAHIAPVLTGGAGGGLVAAAGRF